MRNRFIGAIGTAAILLTVIAGQSQQRAQQPQRAARISGRPNLNGLCRTTPPPAHFGDSWKLPHSFLSSPEVITLTADPVTTSPEEIAAITAEPGHLRDALLSEYMNLITKHPHPTDMK